MNIAFTEFMRCQELADNTIISYNTSVNQYFARYPALSKGGIIAYKNCLLQCNKASTVNVKLRGLMKYADFLDLPECKTVKRLKIPQRLDLENVINQEEFERLSAALWRDNRRHYWIVQFFAKTGARVGELTRLKRECLDKGYQDMFSKGKVRRIYIPAGLIQDSREFFSGQSGAMLFVNRAGQPYTRQGILNIMVYHSKRYGIRKEVMHPHSFRHFFAKRFIAKTGDISLLAELLGHSSITTTAIYLQSSTAEKRDRLNAAVDW